MAHDLKEISEIPAADCRKLRGVFCDIDDTLTCHGKLLDSAYHALWEGHRAGLRIVPITGRPAGWVDHMARMWPVDAIIGENGAFYFWMAHNKMQRRFIQEPELRRANRRKLEDLRRQILAEIPGAAISADQAYREIDLAVDFCEDVAPLPRCDILRIKEIFESAGAQAKISSIHVNGWFGDFDKMTTCRTLIRDLWQEDPQQVLDHYIFCGDSPNDEPMFAAFPNSVGVANVRPWLDDMQHHPRYCSDRQGGEGFARMMEVILQKRSQ